MEKIFLNQSMSALSWKQPFGTAMLSGKIETRTWSTKYRGLVLICTSKTPYERDSLIEICREEQFEQLFYVIENDKTTFDKNGYAIAIGRLVDCRKMELSDEAKTFVKYRKDLYCHIYEDVKPIKPFAWKGAQSWKKVAPSIIDKIVLIDRKLHKRNFSEMQNELDQLGFATGIQRVHNKCYNYIVNFTIVKTFRNRISAKKRIIKLHKKETNAPKLF